MKAIFVGGPSHGEVREVENPQSPIEVPVEPELGEIVEVGEAVLARTVTYQPMNVAIFGLHLLVFADTDLAATPSLERVVASLLLNPAYREVVLA